LSADNRRMLCARCQAELGIAAGAVDRPSTTGRLQDTERNARELLARWSTQQLLEAPVVSSASVPSPELPSRKVHRIDGAHSAITPPAMSSSMKPGSDAPAASSSEPRETPRRRKLARPKLAPETHPASSSTEPGHADHTHDELVRMAVQQPLAKHANWSTIVGQLCAYGGVAVLTLGTVMVLAGYFGGPSNYAPTGWLVAAVGQMLLFLGVVTLVSGGMEQTVDEVAWRIDFLAEQIMRLEQTVSEQEATLKELRRAKRPAKPHDDQASAA